MFRDPKTNLHGKPATYSYWGAHLSNREYVVNRNPKLEKLSLLRQSGVCRNAAHKLLVCKIVLPDVGDALMEWMHEVGVCHNPLVTRVETRARSVARLHRSKTSMSTNRGRCQILLILTT